MSGSLELLLSQGAFSRMKLPKLHHRVALDGLALLSQPIAGSSLTDKTFSSISLHVT
jgi:hypothetical protein